MRLGNRMGKMPLTEVGTGSPFLAGLRIEFQEPFLLETFPAPGLQNSVLLFP